MSTALKLVFDTDWLDKITVGLKEHLAELDEVTFRQAIFCTDWPDMALKQRIRHVANVLIEVLPEQYGEALPILETVATEFNELPHLVFTDYVEQRGLQHPEQLPLTLEALKRLTEGCSSEFAIRPFIELDQNRVLSEMLDWASDASEHVRRLASEGCRPRLPWANALPALKENPEPLRIILEALKADESLYVRKSVANNLNDISKDHPLWVLQICQQWKGQQANTDWIIKHGLRSLLKQGNPVALALLDYPAPVGVKVFDLDVSDVLLGQKCHFTVELDLEEFTGGKVRLEYAITFVRKQRKPYRKVFKIGESLSETGIKKIVKSHDFKKISTRNYCPGIHKLELIMNGQTLAEQSFLVRKNESN